MARGVNGRCGVFLEHVAREQSKVVEECGGLRRRWCGVLN